MCPRLEEGSWKAPHTPFKRSWTPLLTPITDRWGGRGGGAELSTRKAIMMSSLLRVKFCYDTHTYGDAALMDAFFTDLMRVHTRERNIIMLIWYKYRYLVLKPLTRHYTLIPIFDRYRFLMSNQYRGAGSAIPKSIRGHGGGSSLFASAAELLERRPADVSRGRCWEYWPYLSVFSGDTGGLGRTRAEMRRWSGARL